MNTYQKLFTVLTVLLGAACGNDAQLLSNDLEDPDPRGVTEEHAAAYIDSRTSIPMPWTLVLSAETLEGATIEDTRITLRNQPQRPITEGDVLVSAQPEASFLRKVLSVEEGAEFVIKTRNATLEEAIYKGQVSFDEPAPAADAGDRRQLLSAGMREDLGGGQIGASDGSMQSGSGPISFSINPSLNLNSNLYFDLKVEPRNQRMPDAYTSCDAIISAMDFAAENPACGAQWERYYRSNGRIYRHDSDIGRACTGRGFMGIMSAPVYYPPDVEEIRWAKESCTGGLKRFVMDYQLEVKPTTGNIGVAIGASGSGTTPLFRAEKSFARKVFFVGWVPIVVTMNGTYDIDAEYSITANGLSLSLEPLSVEDITVGAGVAFHASEADDDGRGVQVNGSFVPFFQGETGWHMTPPRLPNPTIRGLANEQDLTIARQIEGSIKLSAAPGMNLLLYDVVGPFIEPFSLYGEIKAGGAVSASLGGNSETGLTGACDDTPYGVCARVGIEGKIGIDATAIFTEGQWSTDLWKAGGTCSNFCPLHDEMPLCWKSCLGGETNDPVEIELRWSNPQLDLDLELTAPYVIDYHNDSPQASKGYYFHDGDVCPSQFPICVDDPVGGYYREFIKVDPDQYAPASNVGHTIVVETYDAQTSGSFELIVRQNGTEVHMWSGSSGTTGNIQTFQFVTTN